jgi:2,3-bisphosphoglycerate-independent phosphoglycerate mutase
MVGHTANVPAIIEAVEEVDIQLGRVIAALEKKGGVAFVTADHGNAEVNIDLETGKKHTAHTINPVPAIVTSNFFKKMKKGTLADIAPTILNLLDIKKPDAMTGRVLTE